MNIIGKRLEIALKELGITAYNLSKQLGYKSPDTVYNILKNTNSISQNFINRIKLNNIPINTDWLVDGIGKPIISKQNSGDGTEEKLLLKWIKKVEYMLADTMPSKEEDIEGYNNQINDLNEIQQVLKYLEVNDTSKIKGELLTGDLKENTMTFQIEGEVNLKAGKYIITPVEE